MSKEIKIGIAFVIAIALLYFGISFLKGVNIFKPANTYYVSFDNVTDLTVSSPVVLKGYQIGLVHSMELDQKTKNIIVTINMNKGVKIPVGSTMKLEGGMLGGATVSLDSSNSTQYFSPGDTITGKRTSGLMDAVGGVLPQVSDLVPKIDSILVGLQAVVNHPALINSIGNVESITSDLTRSTRQLNNLIAALNKDVPVITSNFAHVSQDLSKQVNSIDLAASYRSIDSTLKNIQTLSERINSKDNSVGLLLNDRQLYDSLSTTLNNASLLLKDVKENPGRYINVKVF